MLSKVINRLGIKSSNGVYAMITEDAQSKLRKYLSELKLYSTLSKDSSEVYEDIQALINEKVSTEFQNSSKKLTLEAISTILNKIGTPKEILANNDIDVEKLIEANPMFRISLAISSFAIGENKVLSLITRFIGVTVTIAVIAIVTLVIAILSDIQIGLRDALIYDLLWEEGFGAFTKSLAITFIPLIFFAIASFWIPYTKKVSKNLFYVANILVFVIFVSILLQNGGSLAQRSAILVNNYSSATTSTYFDRTKKVSIGESGFKEVSIQINVNQINDVPEIYIVKADQKYGASFSYPYELSYYADGFLYANPENSSVQLSYDAKGFREMCGPQCLVARGSKPELHVYVNENAKVNIKYNFSHEMSMQGYGTLPVEVHNLGNINLSFSSSNSSTISLNAQNINKLDLNISQSANLAVTGYLEELNVTNRDEGWFSTGFNLLAPGNNYILNYAGYNASIANIAKLGTSTFDLYDKAVLMYLEKGIGESEINKHGDEVTVIE